MSALGNDTFLQKTDDELRYLVAHSEFYHSALIMAATQELRRRGIALPTTPDPSTPAPQAYDNYEEETPAAWRRWLPALLILVVLGLGGWLLLRSKRPATPKPVAAAPIVLESVKAQRLPDFEATTKAQVQLVRQQLSAADRADTTATGRYLRMARRYFLAENQAAYLTQIAKGDSAAGTFPGQIDLTLERISWFMKAKAYNQHLHPVMEERLALMQQALTLRRNSLMNFKSRYESGMPMMDRDMNRADFEAQDISNELRGKASERAPIRGNITDL